MTTPLFPRLALLLGLGLALAARDEQLPPPAGPHQMRPETAVRRAQRAERMAKHLGLSEAQKTQIKAIHQKHQDELKGTREATHQARKAFFEAVKNPDTPLDQLRKLHQTMSDKAFDMLAARRAVRLETRQILTPVQREKIAEAQGRMAERMKLRRERFRAMAAQP